MDAPSLPHLRRRAAADYLNGLQQSPDAVHAA
jgi:hypothetical protein